jgi:peroxiredoxin
MALQIGDQAPSFKLVNTDKKEVSLEDYKGKNLVILFFPLAYTGVCTTELCTIRDDIQSYNNVGSDVVAISVDSFATLGKFKEDQNLNFDLLSDFNKDVSGSYGALYDEFVLGMKGVSKRSAFVVGPNGKIKYAEVLESAGDLPNFDAIKAAMG